MKKIPSIVLPILMVCALLPVAALPAFADDNTYIMRSWDDEKKEIVEEAIPIPADAHKIDSTTTRLEGGWYVVEGNVTISDENLIRLNETSHIILKDGCTLQCFGIIIGSADLYIYGQSGDTGTIYAQSDADNAGIGGISPGTTNGKVTIYGGTVNASSNHGAGIGGGFGGHGITVNIYGGIINASSTEGSGIGGGARTEWDEFEINGGITNIYGGTVTASGCQGIGIGEVGNDDPGDPGEINIFCTYSMKAGGAAPGRETTLKEYKQSRERYVQITTPNLTGSIISEGTPWIIGGVAAIVAAGVAALVIVRKKKKTA